MRYGKGHNSDVRLRRRVQCSRHAWPHASEKRREVHAGSAGPRQYVRCPGRDHHRTTMAIKCRKRPVPTGACGTPAVNNGTCRCDSWKPGQPGARNRLNKSCRRSHKPGGRCADRFLAPARRCRTPTCTSTAHANAIAWKIRWPAGRASPTTCCRARARTWRRTRRTSR